MAHLHGSGVLTLDGVKSRVRRADAIVFPSRVPHQLRNDEADRLGAVSLYWTAATDAVAV